MVPDSISLPLCEDTPRRRKKPTVILRLFGNDPRFLIELAAVKDARLLHAALLQILDLLLSIDKGDLVHQRAALSHSVGLHLGYTLRSVVEPFPRYDYPILRLEVGGILLQPFLHQG